MSQKARDYNDAATGARSNPVTRSGQAPALERTMPDGSTRPVKFDGVDSDVMIDRKISVVTTEKAKAQALRQSEVLTQNGLVGRGKSQRPRRHLELPKCLTIWELQIFKLGW
jgi:filamentous hemagglutinin